MANLNVSLFGNGNSYSNPIKKGAPENSDFYSKGPLNFYANESKKPQNVDKFVKSNPYRDDLF